jgi:DNA-binding LytR/AlgR family response regulator
MKVITTFFFIENNDLERIVIETVNSFKGIEIMECVSDKYSFLERIGSKMPDIVFMEINDQVDQKLQIFDMINKPLFPIAIASDDSYAQRLMDKGFFDVISGPITKELLASKIYKIFKMTKDIVERFNSNLIVSSPKNEYVKKYLTKSVQSEYVYLKYKMTRIKVPIEEILYISNIKEFIIVVTESGRKLFHQGSLKRLLEVLPGDQIIRINNTTAVNYKKVEKVYHNSVTVGEQKFTVSRLYINKLKELLKLKPVS